MKTKEELDEMYRNEGWGELAEKALGIPPSDVESQARRVARYANEELTKMRESVVESAVPDEMTHEPLRPDESAQAQINRIQYVKGWNDCRSAMLAAVVNQQMTPAARDVLAERRRQIEAEGWTSEQDDDNVNDEIAAMAALYVMPEGARDWDASSTGYGETLREAMVPHGWYMPTFKNRRDQLVKGAALALAELERIDRAAAPKLDSIEISPHDIEVSTFNTGGSWLPNQRGVRILHIPTRLAVESSEFREPHKNKQAAMDRLRDLLEHQADTLKTQGEQP